MNHFDPYASCQALFACVRMFLCHLLCIDREIKFLTSEDVERFSYSFGETLKVEFSWPSRNSDAIGPSIPWWSMVNGSILWFLVMSSCASCSDVEFEGGWSRILNFLYS